MQRHVGSLTATGPEGAPVASEFVNLSDVAAFIKQHLPAILMTLGAGLVLAIVYVATAQPIFTARAEIIIDPKMTQLTRQQMGDISFSLDNAQVESQIAVIRSEKISQTVVSKLELAKDPEFQKSTSLLAGLQELLGSTLGRKKVQSNTDADGNRTAVAIFEDGLEVRRIGLSYAIEILYSSRDADKAARDKALAAKGKGAIDGVKVAPGWERALSAVLGRDARAMTGPAPADGDGRFWTGA